MIFLAQFYLCHFPALIISEVVKNKKEFKMAAEAAELSKLHQAWMVETLKAKGGNCTYEDIVHVGEEKQCDTVGAMLRVLKKKKVIAFEGEFLMFPDDKATVIQLLIPDYDPLTS